MSGLWTEDPHPERKRRSVLTVRKCRHEFEKEATTKKGERFRYVRIYLCVNEQELKLSDYMAHRSFYCGLCRNLHQRYGRTRPDDVKSGDLTFLAILLTGLYEPETKRRASPLYSGIPFLKHQMTENEAAAYAADMTVLLSYQKMQDDQR